MDEGEEEEGRGEEREIGIKKKEGTNQIWGTANWLKGTTATINDQ